MKRTTALVLALTLLIVLLATGLGGCADGAGGSIGISEVCAKNKGILADENGEYPDWIELHNRSDAAVSLAGYALSDGSEKYSFPDITVEAGGYFVVYADGKNYADRAAGIVHADFSVSEGETVTLYGSYGEAISQVTVPATLEANYTVGEGGVYFRYPTPRRENAPTYDPATEQHDDWQKGMATAESTLCINEYATSSSITLEDGDGDYCSWVEICNTGNAAVSLEGYTLSDNAGRPAKWIFPECEIAAGGYLIVYLSSKTEAPAGQLHASFSLSGEEDALLLFDAGGALVSSAPVRKLTSNLSCGRSEAGEWVYYPKPTPGKPNTTTYFDDIESARYPSNKELTVNEVAAVNASGVTAGNGQRYDYIEIKNMTDKVINLKGYQIFGGQGPEDRHTLPAVSVAAGGYRLIWCGADADSYNSRTDDIYITSGLNRYKQTVCIADPDGTVIDVLRSGRLDDGISCGRVSADDDTVRYFEKPTPGAANPATGLEAKSPAPVFSVESGYVAAGTQVEITAPDATIYYTTDGSVPTAASKVYTKPFTITENTVIRAVARVEGHLLSEDRAGSYILDDRRSLDTIFLAIESKYLYDYNIGMFADGPGYTEPHPHSGANYWKDWERAVHFEYVTTANERVLEFNAGMKVFGQFSRTNPQKSVSINLRDRYGPTSFSYPLFENGATNVFSELVLRDSGQDYGTAHLRDAFVATAVEGEMDIDVMSYRPVAVYINGEYWGLYDLREKICESYAANRTGCEEEEVDMIKGNNMVMAGTYAGYKDLLAYVSSHDLSVQEYYDYVASQVDIDELINYWIVITYFGNTDTGNIKFYKAGDGAKWRYVVFDQDYCLYPSTHQWNMVEEMINPKGHGVGHYFSTTLMRGLFKNKGFKEQFLRTYGEYLRGCLSSERLVTLLDGMEAEIADEMALQIARWNTHGGKVSAWESRVAALRTIVEGRSAQIRQDIINTFACLGGSTYGAAYKMSKDAVIALLDGKE